MYEGATHVKLISLEDYLSSLTIWLGLLFLKLFLNVWYLIKDFITWGKIHVIRLLNNWHFFHKRVLKWSLQLYVKGLVGVRQWNKILFPVFPPFQLYHQHKNMAVLQLIGLEKYENVRRAWVANRIWIYDFLKISTLANWATQ